MKHRLIGSIALAALACAVVAAGAAGGGKGQLYQFRGELLATGANSVQVQVEGGNHAALKALIGQSQNETFTTDSKTEFLGWTAGVPHVISIADLKAGDNVQVSVRAKHGASLADLAGETRRARRRPRQQLGRHRPRALPVRRHRRRRPGRRPHRPARHGRQLARAALDARAVARRDVHL